MDKIDKIIFRRISNRIDENKITEISYADFQAMYIAELMFLFVDTYGLTRPTVEGIVRECLKESV